MALGATGIADSAPFLLAMSFLIGALSVVPQIVVPFIATISGSEERGRNIGTVMSGLILGILLARTVSGFIGAHLGWRAVYFCAAVAMILLAGLIQIMLPETARRRGLNYLDLLTSLPGLLHKLPVLKEAALSGAFLFAAFSIFWTTLIFQIEALHSHSGIQTAGYFGLVGGAGAVAASLSGRLVDRLGARRIVSASTGVVLFAWILMGIRGSSVLALLAVQFFSIWVFKGDTWPTKREFLLICPKPGAVSMRYTLVFFSPEVLFRILGEHFCLGNAGMAGSLSTRRRLDGTSPPNKFRNLRLL